MMTKGMNLSLKSPHRGTRKTLLMTIYMEGLLPRYFSDGSCKE